MVEANGAKKQGRLSLELWFKNVYVMSNIEVITTQDWAQPAGRLASPPTNQPTNRPAHWTWLIIQTHNSRVSNQNGISRLYIFVKK